MDKGFITLHRKLTEWEWYSNINTFRLFIHLLLIVNWEDKKWQSKIIKRGSIITSIAHLAKSSNLSPQKVRTSLDNLILTGEIEKYTTNKYTLLTVVKYDVYQNKDNVVTNKQQTNNKQITTTKQLKPLRTINIPDYLDFKLYAFSNSDNIDSDRLKLKYESWKVNNWKDGNNKPIKNWKSKLLNTLPYLTKKNINYKNDAL